jgi:ABC-type lipoprotein release transport system permease subunit
MITSGLTTFAWRNLWRNARRTLVLISVFTLGLFTMLLIQSFLQGWIKGTFESTYKNLAEPIQIHHPSYVEQPEVAHFFQADSSLMSLLQSTPGLKFAKRIRINATIQSEYDSVSVTVIGIDPQSEIGISFLPDAISQGEYLGSSPGLVMGEKLAKRLTTQLNRRVVLMAQKHGGGLAEIGLPIQGLFRHADPRMEESLVFMPIATADNWLNLTSGIHEIGLLPSQVDAQSVKALTLELQQSLPELSVRSIWQRQPVLEATMELSDQMIWIWLGFVLLLMMLGMLNTLMMSLYERQQEFLLLYSLGLKPGKLRRLLGYEIGFILSLSTLLAMGLSILMIWSFRGGVELTTFAEGAAQFGMGTTLYLILDVEKWGQVLIATLITTAVFSLWPIWRATRHKALNVR